MSEFVFTRTYKILERIHMDRISIIGELASDPIDHEDDEGRCSVTFKLKVIESDNEASKDPVYYNAIALGKYANYISKIGLKNSKVIALGTRLEDINRKFNITNIQNVKEGNTFFISSIKIIS